MPIHGPMQTSLLSDLPDSDDLAFLEPPLNSVTSDEKNVLALKIFNRENLTNDASILMKTRIVNMTFVRASEAELFLF
jgi:hypothetical protein